MNMLYHILQSQKERKVSVNVQNNIHIFIRTISLTYIVLRKRHSREL